MRKASWIGALMLLAGCGGPESDPVRVAIAMAENQRAGVVLAVEEINANGGVGGRSLQVLGLDWTDPGLPDHAKIIGWADQLSADPTVLAVIGHTDSNSTLAAAGLYNARRIPHLVTVATNPLITEAGPWTFRLCLDDAAQGNLLANYAFTDWNRRRAAVFYVNDDYGRGLAETFISEYSRIGGAVVAQNFHTNRLTSRDTRMLSVVVDRLAAASQPPDVLVFLNRPQAASQILALARAAGLTAPVLGGDNLSRVFRNPDAVQVWSGARISQFFLPNRESDPAKRILAQMRRLRGFDPTYETAFAYDAVYLLKRAVEARGATRQGVRDYLETLAGSGQIVEAFGGDFSFDPSRNARRALYIVEVQAPTPRLVATRSPG